jgi:hypothetical protein
VILIHSLATVLHLPESCQNQWLFKASFLLPKSFFLPFILIAIWTSCLWFKPGTTYCHIKELAKYQLLLEPATFLMLTLSLNSKHFSINISAHEASAY